MKLKRQRYSYTRAVDDGYQAFLARRGLALQPDRPLKQSERISLKRRAPRATDQPDPGYETPRQTKLIEQRCRDIEHGKLKSCAPRPGDPPLRPLVTDQNCPTCRAPMVWYPGRNAFLCPHCQ